MNQRVRNACVVVGAGALAAAALVVAPSDAADHLEAPLVQADGRTDINDMYAFQSPDDPANTVFAMTVNPAAGLLSPTTFDPDGTYHFRIDQDLSDPDDATADATISVDFGAVDANGVQDVTVSGAASGSGTTGTEIALAGGGSITAGSFEDPFFFDLAGFQGTVKGMGSAQLCEPEGVTTGEDFFAGLNVSAIVVEVPSSSITDGSDGIGMWGETDTTNNPEPVTDRMGRPAIATVLVPDGSEDAYNAADPDDHDANFASTVANVLQALSGLDGTGYDDATGDALADAFLPDILTIDTSSTDGYGGPTKVLNGRQLADDVIDISLPVVTGDASAVGGPDVGAVLTTDCVAGNDKAFPGTFPFLAPANVINPAPVTSYALVLENLTGAQPLSPPVAVTHNQGLPTAVAVVEVGKVASAEVQAIAQGGDPVPLTDALLAERQLSPAIITDVVNLNRPLTPDDERISGSVDRAVYAIDARPGDVLSLVGQLACTNDGFVGLDRVALPASATTYPIAGLDAGTEENTELSEHLVDRCSDLGPAVLNGDPDGNVDAGPGVATDPAGPIASHPGVNGTLGDLLPAHDWTDPAASLTIVPLADAFGDDDLSVFENDINLLAAAGITEGTSATTFSPVDLVTRGELAAFVNRALDLPAAATGPFTDVAGSTFESDINALFAAGIVQGTSATTFSPNQTLTRGQMAAVLSAALDLPPSVGGPFSDIVGSPFEAEINAVFAAGLTEGTTSTTFSPNEPIVRAQEAAFIARALGGR